MTNTIKLHLDLKKFEYKHSLYEAFNISDPKPRNIHKAQVRDRLLHHALYNILQPFFDRTFISDSYSCRIGKGTHRAINRFKYFANKVSRNSTRTCWVLKCDIRKFFASIDHEIMIGILKTYIPDEKIINVLKIIIDSFQTSPKWDIRGRGLPLGNLTSQLLVNIFMNEFDQYVKHKLKVKYYMRYADDFVFLSEDKNYLENILSKVSEFLENNLKLSLHPDKVFIKTLATGVDFLGWVNFSHHRVLRTATKRRMFAKLKAPEISEATIQSCKGLLSHGNTYKIGKEIDTIIQKNL